MMFDRALCVDMPEIAQQLPRIQRLRAALQRFSLTWIITRPAGRILCKQIIEPALQPTYYVRDRRFLQPFSAGKGIALRAGGQLIEHKTARGCRWILRAGARGQRRAASGGQDVAGNISGRAQTSKNTTSGGGSSSVLSSAFAEAAFRLSAGASTTTRRPPRCALREQKSINALTCSILISALWTRAFSAVEPVEAVALPFADSALFSGQTKRISG